MNSQPINKKSVQKFAALLDRGVELMRKLGVERYEQDFREQAQIVRSAKSMKEIRKIQKELRRMLTGTYATLNDILSFPGEKIVTKETMAVYDKFHSRLGWYARRPFWF